MKAACMVLIICFFVVMITHAVDTLMILNNIRELRKDVQKCLLLQEN